MIYCSKCGSKVGVTGPCKVCKRNTKKAKASTCLCGAPMQNGICSVKGCVCGTFDLTTRERVQS